MLSDQEIQEIQKQSQKSEAINKLWHFYRNCQVDGIKAFGISLNKKLIVLSEQIDNADIDITKIDDKVFDRIFKAMTDGGKIAENLKSINKNNSVSSEEDEGRPFTDRMADKKRDK